jgi:hypothetical protein
MNKTKIITTFGPGTESEEKMVALIRVSDLPEPLELKAGYISYGNVSSR